jgi:hypothetical protein
LGPQRPQQIEAIHARHDQVGHEQVRLEGCQLFQRFLAVACLLDPETPGLDIACERLAQAPIVIYYEHSGA